MINDEERVRVGKLSAAETIRKNEIGGSNLPRQSKQKAGRFASWFAKMACFSEFGVFFPGKTTEN